MTKNQFRKIINDLVGKLTDVSDEELKSQAELKLKVLRRRGLVDEYTVEEENEPDQMHVVTISAYKSGIPREGEYFNITVKITTQRCDKAT